MSTPPSAPRLAYLAVMLVAAGFLLLYLFRGGNPPRPAQADGVSQSSVDLESVLSTGDAAAIRGALRPGLDLNSPMVKGTYRGLSPLHIVVTRALADAIAPLIQAGADPDARTADGTTALMIAAVQESTPALSELLTGGASPDVRDSYGRSALMLAARAGKSRSVESLISAGADVRTVDGTGATALWHAAGVPGNEEVIRRLLAAGAELDIADSQGVTPLMRSAELADTAQVILLLDLGAAPGSRSRDGRTALDRARVRTDKHGLEIAAILEQAGR